MKCCLQCKNEIENHKKFCNSSCAAKYNNAKRGPQTSEQRLKRSIALKKYFAANPNRIQKGIKHSIAVGSATKGTHKPNGIENFSTISLRTKTKIINRLQLKCCICGWKESSIDIHHILPRKLGGGNDLDNLTPVCPNHHRLADRNLIAKEDLTPLSKLITVDQLNSVYFG